jgi:hypothetical protein
MASEIWGKIAQLLKVAKTFVEPKKAKYVSSTHFGNLKLPTTDNVFKLLI